MTPAVAGGAEVMFNIIMSDIIDKPEVETYAHHYAPLEDRR
jgi:hypothetical protein